VSIFAGAAAPEQLRFPIKGPPGIDLRLVSAVTAQVVKPGNVRATWIFTIDPDPSMSKIVVVRVFAADGRDVPSPGTLHLGFRFVFPGNIVRRSKPISEPILVWLPG